MDKVKVRILDLFKDDCVEENNYSSIDVDLLFKLIQSRSGHCCRIIIDLNHSF